MRVFFIITFITTIILSSPVMGMEKMSTNELKKTTAQLASSVGNASLVGKPAAGIYGLATKLIDANKHLGNLRDAVGPAVEAQKATEPASIVINVAVDTNTVKSGLTLGFF